MYVCILIVDDLMYEGEGREFMFFLFGVFIFEGMVIIYYLYYVYCGLRVYKIICLVGDIWVMLYLEKVIILF